MIIHFIYVEPNETQHHNLHGKKQNENKSQSQLNHHKNKIKKKKEILELDNFLGLHY